MWQQATNNRRGICPKGTEAVAVVYRCNSYTDNNGKFYETSQCLRAQLAAAQAVNVDLLAACKKAMAYETDCVASNGADYDGRDCDDEDARADFDFIRAAIASAEAAK
jgi:hypothetical protein